MARQQKVLISDVLRVGSPPLKVDVDLTGARFLELLIDDGNDVSTGDNADWAGGLIFLKAGATEKPESWTFPAEPPPPIASGWPATPRINPPRITGGTPGRPFIFRVPATGDAPLTFAARNLPTGLTLDPKTGVITGAIRNAGKTDVEITVTNKLGKAARTLTIVGGSDALALTPPLGWNSWNVWGRSVDEAKVRAAADAMESSGRGRRRDPLEAHDLCGQIRQALRNVVTALAAAGARPGEITRLTWYITDRDQNRSNRKAIGEVYREILGRHFPAMSVVVVNALIEPEALVEIEATAVVRD